MHIGQISSDMFSCNTLEFEHEAIFLSRKECMEIFFYHNKNYQQR